MRDSDAIKETATDFSRIYLRCVTHNSISYRVAGACAISTHHARGGVIPSSHGYQLYRKVSEGQIATRVFIITLARHIRDTRVRPCDIAKNKPESAMSDNINHQRRRLFGAAALTLAAVEFGVIGQAEAQTPASASPSAPPVKAGTHTSFEALKQVRTKVLDIGYAEAGPADGPVVLLLHGWPYDIYSYVDVAPILADAGYRVIIPYLRGYGTTRFLSDKTVRNAQQAALAVDMIDFMDALKINQAIVGGFDWGARTVNIMAALWPERCKAMVSVSGYLIGSQEANKKPLPPQAELAWWYQFYFATERGREGYDKYRHDFAKLIWKLASPNWHFDDETFDRSAKALENPDNVAITIDNYRWRLGLAASQSKYDALERKLATSPTIGIPTITMEGDANGAPHPEPSSYAKKFTGKYEHRNITGGIGHNLPQEAPQAFAQAILDVDRL